MKRTKELEKRGLAVDMAFIQLSIAIIIFLFFARKFIYFRDYSILWDGAVRMVNGASPLSDFGMPTGPVSLFIPYVFLKYMGIHWFAFQLAQLFQSALMIISAYALSRQLGENRLVSGLAILVLSLFYLVFQTHPWYNVTALLLLFFAFNLAATRKLPGLFLSGAVAGICFFCKQDFGALSFGTVGLWILFDHLRVKPDLRALWRPVLCVSLGFALTIALAISFYDLNHFLYWFNLGQPPHVRRAVAQWATPLLGLAACLLFAGYARKAPNLFVYGLICLVAAVTSQTSGLFYTHYYFVFVIPALVHHLMVFSKGNYVSYLAVIFCGFASVPAINDAALVAQGLATHGYAPYYSDSQRLEPISRTVHLGDCSPVMRNVYGPEDVCRLLRDVQQAMQSNGIAPGGHILNMSELTPLTHILGLAPPQQHPLWYHLKVSLFAREEQLIVDQVNSAYFDVVLLQAAHDGPSLFQLNLAKSLNANPAYQRLGDFYYSPSSLTDCGERKPCRIVAFVRKHEDAKLR